MPSTPEENLMPSPKISPTTRISPSDEISIVRIEPAGYEFNAVATGTSDELSTSRILPEDEDLSETTNCEGPN
jgi:hypothetical protein